MESVLIPVLELPESDRKILWKPGEGNAASRYACCESLGQHAVNPEDRIPGITPQDMQSNDVVDFPLVTGTSLAVRFPVRNSQNAEYTRNISGRPL